MTDPTAAWASLLALSWLFALAFLAGYGAAELQQLLGTRYRAGRRSNGNCVPLPPAPSWRTVRLDEGRVQSGNKSGEATTPKPEIIPKPQPSGGRLIRVDRDPGPLPEVQP